MEVQVVYYSRGGHTRKLAAAIAKGAGVTAQSLGKVKLNQPVDIMFLGGAIYKGFIDAKLTKFVSELPAGQVGKIVLFTNSLSGRSIARYIKPLLANKVIMLEEREFRCKGQYLFFNRNRPNTEDAQRARAFAAEIVGAQE